MALKAKTTWEHGRREETIETLFWIGINKRSEDE